MLEIWTHFYHVFLVGWNWGWRSPASCNSVESLYLLFGRCLIYSQTSYYMTLCYKSFIIYIPCKESYHVHSKSKLRQTCFGSLQLLYFRSLQRQFWSSGIFMSWFSSPCQSEYRLGMSRRAVVYRANSKGKMSGAWILQLAGSDFALRFYGKFCGYHIWLVGFESWDYWDTFSVTRS